MLIDATFFEQLKSIPLDLSPQRVGRLTSCDGGLLEVSGLPAPIGDLCEIGSDQNVPMRAEVIGFRNGRTMMVMLGDSALLRPGAAVRSSGHSGLLPVGEAFLGRAVDGLAMPIDDGPPLNAAARWPAGGIRSGSLDRSSVTVPFDTGVRAINALTTVGVGQRVGILAGSGVGKSVLLDMIATHASADVVVVGLIGERAREVSDFVERRMVGDAAARTAVIAVPADQAPNLRLRAAMQATALAEYFRAKGQRVLLILDSLTRVAHAAREIGFLLGEPGGARGYPPSALATVTRLVERAGNSRESGGSVTGLYTVLADGDDHNDPVVDTARAILDGHLVLTRELAQRGQYPAIDVGASLSRVMTDIVSMPHALLARRFRALLSAYESNRDLVLMGAYRSGSDPLVDKAIALHPSLAAFMTQERDEHVTLQSAQEALANVLGHDQP